GSALGISSVYLWRRPGPRQCLAVAIADSADSARLRHVCRDDGAFGLRSEPDQPLYRPTLRTAPGGSGCTTQQRLLRECRSLGQLRASLQPCMATRRKPEPRGCTRRLWMVLSTSQRKRKCPRDAFDEYAASGSTHRSFR